MKNLRFKIILLFLPLIFFQCRKKHPAEETRPFYMGVTPWPADFTTDAVDEAYAFINNHCDFVSHHFDEGIPYEESFSHLAWPTDLVTNIATRKQKTATGKKILLSVSALNLTRKEKADYYRVTSTVSDSVKQIWVNKPVNDAAVVIAYVNYLSYLIDELHPHYVNYGVESNLDTWDGAAFGLYKNFLSQVYSQMKNKYPALPFFISFMVTDQPASLSNASQLLNYTDLVGLSAYPYISSMAMANGNTDPANLPSMFFKNFINLAPAKPWAFAETAYLAENLSIPAFTLNRQGNATWQSSYLELICRLCKDLKAEFLVWYCSSDYDAGSNRLKQLGLYQDLFGLWQDTGFRDENKNERPSYGVWGKWMALRFQR